MSVIDDLVAQAERLVKGINWDDLDSRSVGVPLDPQQDAHLNYWVEYLAPAFNRAADVINTLYYDPYIVNHAATQDSLQGLWGQLKDAAPQVWDQITVQNVVTSAQMWLYSAFESPIPLPAEQFREVISYVWGVVMFGVKLHTTFAIINLQTTNPAAGRAALREHANRIVMICEALALMDQIGALTQLKWDSDSMVKLRETQGVSALKPFYTAPVSTSAPAPPPSSAPVTGLGNPIVAIVLGVVGGIVLMYGIYRWTSMTTEVNKATLQVTKDICADPTYANDPTLKARCVNVLGDALAKTSDVNMFGASLMKYALIGGLIVLGVMFAPQVIHSLKGAFSEARRPASA